MELYKKKLQTRFSFLILYNSILILFVAAFGFFHPTAGSSESMADFMSGVNVGIYALIQLYLVFRLAKYVAVLNDDAKMKALFIYENDERRKMIQSRIGGLGINIIIASLTIATIASGFFNETIYLTLLCTLLFCALVKGILKFYFNKKG